jgi:hypothetical protein
MTAIIRKAVEKADEEYLRATNTYPTTNPKDQWKESTYWYPKRNIVVLGWDGLDIKRCRYDEAKSKWRDEEGRAMFVFMWRRV